MMIVDKSPKERRTYYRNSIAKGSASIMHIEKDTLCTAFFIKDISEEGIFLEGVKDIPIGATRQLVIKLTMPQKQGLWMLDIQATHTTWHKGKKNNIVGTGFKYINLTVEDQILMHTYVAWLREIHIVEAIRVVKEALAAKVVVFFVKR